MQITKSIFVALTLAVFMSGCATSQQVIVGQMMTQQQKMTTAALVPQEGNSHEMNSQIQDQLVTYGITLKPELPTGTRQSNDVDMIVTYSDKWFWDITMYLKYITVNFYDGPTGNLLSTGRWDNSQPHGFHSSRDVIKQLLDEMHSKLLLSSPMASTTPSSSTPMRSDPVEKNSNKPSATDKLKELDSMHKQGLITDSEYANKKQEILKAM